MATISLTWKDLNTGEDKFNIYRSDKPMNIKNMPAPIAVVGENIGSYDDSNVEPGKVYYYVVSVVRGDEERFSSELKTIARNTGPGPFEFIGGDLSAGFYGEIMPEDFINGEELATAVGLNKGIPINNDYPWLKFSLDGRTVFTPLRPIRHSLSWNDLFYSRIVYNTNGTKEIQINGNLYRVTLFSGSLSDPYSGSTSWNTTPEYVIGSEWHRLMYKVSRSNEVGEPWYEYSDSELEVNTSTDGRHAWGQETNLSGTDHRIRLGSSSGIHRISSENKDSRSSDHGWRPVLRLL